MATVNFLFVGPSKSGSTWIYEVLKEHPEVFVPEAKDIYFFDKFYHKGVDWYEKFFKNSQGFKAVGEICHDYFYQKDAIERIKKYNPNMKIMVCLRNPYQRSISSYNYFLRDGFNFSFKEAIERYPFIIEENYYATHLENIFKFFDRENVLILKFDLLKENPREFASRIFKFLGVKDLQLNSIYKRSNPASSPRVRLLAKAAKLSANALRKAGMPNIVGKLKTNPLILKLLFKEGSNVNLTIDDFPKWAVERIDGEMDRLSRLLQDDFSDWKSDKQKA